MGGILKPTILILGATILFCYYCQVEACSSKSAQEKSQKQVEQKLFRFDNTMAEINLEEWSAKLVGKTFVEGERSAGDKNTNTVFRADLPPIHRVVADGAMVTMDLRPERCNVNLDKNNVIVSLTLG